MAMVNSSPAPLFNPGLVRLRETRARAIADESAGFVAKIAADTIADRLSAVNRTFESAADFFSRFDFMRQRLDGAGNVQEVSCFGGMSLSGADGSQETDPSLVLAGQARLPFEPASIGLVTSVFGLHWSGDLPGLLAQIRSSVIPDGLFMAALPGDRTLQELRECLIEAESRITGNASLRVDPFGEVRQYGNLLQRAGFALPVVDSEIVTVRYGSLAGLVRDLRAMGATSALAAPKAFASRQLFELCENLYRERYGDPDGRFRATFEIVQLSGWVPHASQQQPLEPGSAKKSLKDVL